MARFNRISQTSNSPFLGWPSLGERERRSCLNGLPLCFPSTLGDSGDFGDLGDLGDFRVREILSWVGKKGSGLCECDWIDFVPSSESIFCKVKARIRTPFFKQQSDQWNQRKRSNLEELVRIHTSQTRWLLSNQSQITSSNEIQLVFTALRCHCMEEERKYPSSVPTRLQETGRAANKERIPLSKEINFSDCLRVIWPSMGVF